VPDSDVDCLPLGSGTKKKTKKLEVYFVMNMWARREKKAHAAVPEPTTAVDVGVVTQADAPTHPATASEITPDEFLEEVTGLIERLRLPGAVADAPEASCCAQCGIQGVVLKRCTRCKGVFYCGAECQKVAWKLHKKTCGKPLSDDVPLDADPFVVDDRIRDVEKLQRFWAGLLPRNPLHEQPTHYLGP